MVGAVVAGASGLLLPLSFTGAVVGLAPAPGLSAPATATGATGGAVVDVVVGAGSLSSNG